MPGEALGVNLSYLDAALEQLHDSHGSIEEYFSKGLGLSNQTIDALRDRLIS